MAVAGHAEAGKTDVGSENDGGFNIEACDVMDLFFYVQNFPRIPVQT